MATTDKAYCAEADIVRWTQYEADFDATSVPTEAQMLLFTEDRSSELYLLLTSLLNTADAVGPSGYAAPLDTSTDRGLALSYVLRQYSAIGASMDCLQAAGAGLTPARSERIAELFAMWEGRKDALAAAAEAFAAAGSSSSATHISSGEITEKSVTAKEEDGLVFDGSTKF